MSASNRLVFVALVAIGTVLVSGENAALAQSGTRMPYEANAQPPLELPAASAEGNMFLSTEDVIPNSAQSIDGGYVEGGYAGEGYVDGGYSDGGYSDGTYAEPAPAAPIPAANSGRPMITDPGVSWDKQCDPAPIYSTNSWWWRGNWYTQMDFMVLDRVKHRDLNLVNIGGFNILSEEFARHSAAPGTRITLGRFLGRDAASRDHMIELAFMGLFDWEDGRTVSGDPGSGQFTSSIGVPAAAAPAFVGADTLSFFYNTDFNDFQVNYRLQARPGKDVMALQPNGQWVQHAVSSRVVSLLGGLRVSSLNEQATLRTVQQALASQVDVTDGIDQSITPTDLEFDDGGTTGFYRVRTHNDMIGLHFGGEWTQKHESWSWGLRGRVGGMVNLINRRSTIRAVIRDQRVDGLPVDVRRQDDDGNDLFTGVVLDDDDNPQSDGTATTEETTTIDVGGVDTVFDNFPLFDQETIVTFDQRTELQGQSNSDERLSFVIEAGIFGKYQLRPNLAFRAGYDVILYSNLALAPENFGNTIGFDQLSVTGTSIFHGGFAGFETTW